MSRARFGRLSPCLVKLLSVVMLTMLAPLIVRAQLSSVSAWDAADFRIWGYIPYWATSSQISGFATNGMYTHVSDVLYFGGAAAGREWQYRLRVRRRIKPISTRSGRRRRRTASSST